MSSFWLGLTVGLVHWRLFLMAVKKLCGSSDEGRAPLWRVSLVLSWLRFLVTGLLLYALLCGGATPMPMLVGLIVSGLVFRVFAHQRATRL